MAEWEMAEVTESADDCLCGHSLAQHDGVCNVQTCPCLTYPEFERSEDSITEAANISRDLYIASLIAYVTTPNWTDEQLEKLDDQLNNVSLTELSYWTGFVQQAQLTGDLSKFWTVFPPELDK